MDSQMFSSDFDAEDGIETVKLRGEIDHHSASVLRRELDTLICVDRPKTLVIDLSAVDFMDSSGLGLIMGRYTLLDGLGGETVLLNPTDRIRKILDLAGFGRICRVETVKRQLDQGKAESKRGKEERKNAEK